MFPYLLNDLFFSFVFILILFLVNPFAGMFSRTLIYQRTHAEITANKTFTEMIEDKRREREIRKGGGGARGEDNGGRGEGKEEGRDSRP